MRNYSYQIINQYDINVLMPPLMDSKNEQLITEILDKLNIFYKKDFCFDDYKQHHFDFAIMKKDGTIAFLLEFDGESHYDPNFYKGVGNRIERNKFHIVKNQFASANKARISIEKHVPLLRVDKLYVDFKSLKDTIITWIWKFVDGFNVINQEVSMVMMFDKYGWDYDYIPQSDASKPTLEFLHKRDEFIKSNGYINCKNWNKFYNKDMLNLLLKKKNKNSKCKSENLQLSLFYINE